jgi:hypothetical protein
VFVVFAGVIHFILVVTIQFRKRMGDRGMGGWGDGETRGEGDKGRRGQGEI